MPIPELMVHSPELISATCLICIQTSSSAPRSTQTSQSRRMLLFTQSVTTLESENSSVCIYRIHTLNTECKPSTRLDSIYREALKSEKS